MKKILLFPVLFVVVFIVCYLVLGGIGVFFWVVAEFGIWLRDILQWILEGVLTPYNWFVDFMSTLFK
jgi:hypothetical protein